MTNPRPTISAIIPAFNEEETIEAVVTVAARHPSIDEVIVVDDGSTDRTGTIARRAGARIIRNTRNCGKAQSMDNGVKESSGEIVLFLDADLIGLTQGHISSLIDPVASKAADMTIAIRDRGQTLTTLTRMFGPWIAGERAMRRSLWNHVPKNLKEGFMIELALNYTAKNDHCRIELVYLPGLHIRTKEEKMGVSHGLQARLKMIKDMVRAWWKLRMRI